MSILKIKVEINRLGLILEITLIIIGVILIFLEMLECNCLDVFKYVLYLLIIIIGILALRHNISGGIISLKEI